jgi:hypothetical protein
MNDLYKSSLKYISNQTKMSKNQRREIAYVENEKMCKIVKSRQK